jgi:hypothetical protein
MSALVPANSQLYALPDDVLRALAASVPPSGLIALAQCSQRLAAVLRAQLTRRLDGLFVATRQLTESEMEYSLRLANSEELQTFKPRPTSFELQAMFGVAHQSSPENRLFSDYYFVEAAKGYDGPPHMLTCT